MSKSKLRSIFLSILSNLLSILLKPLSIFPSSLMLLAARLSSFMSTSVFQIAPVHSQPDTVTAPNPMSPDTLISPVSVTSGFHMVPLYFFKLRISVMTSSNLASRAFMESFIWPISFLITATSDLIGSISRVFCFTSLKLVCSGLNPILAVSRSRSLISTALFHPDPFHDQPPNRSTAVINRLWKTGELRIAVATFIFLQTTVS